MKEEISTRFQRKVNMAADTACWEWLAARDGDGYGIFWANGKNVKAHRFALKLTGLAVPDHMQVCHKCDNPPCCNPAHLFLGTLQDNLADRQRKGRQPHGETHYNARLSDADIRAIRDSTGRTSMLAKQFSIDRTYVWQIRAGIKRNIPHQIDRQ